jgi:hypothetical protein
VSVGLSLVGATGEGVFVAAVDPFIVLFAAEGEPEEVVVVVVEEDPNLLKFGTIETCSSLLTCSTKLLNSGEQVTRGRSG